MQLSYGSMVYSADGQNLGSIKELIVNPRHRVVTHLVVQSGLFFSHDRLISVEHIKSTEDNAVYLSITDQALEEATLAFDQDQYVELEDEEVTKQYGVGGTIWLRPTHDFAGAGFNTIIPPGVGPIPPEPEVSIPSDEVSLEHGAQVISSDDIALGTLQECLTDENERITHLKILEGRWLKESKTIPVDWVRKIEENTITLGVPLSVVEKI